MQISNFDVPILLSSKGILILSLSISIPVLIAVCILLGIFLHRKGFSSSLKKYMDMYNSSKNILDTTCTSMITRLSTLGKSNEDYNHLCSMREEQKEMIIKEKGEDVLKTTSQLRQLLKQKKYKGAKVQDKVTKDAINDYVNKIKQLEEDLSNDLKEDEETRNASIDIKKRYRDIKDFYKNHVDELKTISTFDVFFDEVDSLFSKFDDLLDKAEYQKALKTLPKAEEKIVVVEKIINDLPTLETLIVTVVPNKIKQIKEEYKILLENGFVLSYLDVDKRVDNISSGLIHLQEKVLAFDLSNVNDTLNDYQNDLTNILLAFESEREAKNYYETNRSRLIKDSFDVEKDYQKTLQRIDINAKTFVLNQNKIDEIRNKRADLDVIFKYHRKFESFDTEKIVEPYTVIVKQMKYLNDEVTSLNNVIKDYYDYIQLLNNSAQDMFNNLAKYYEKLKDAEVIVRHVISLDVYTEQTISNFEQLYKTISLINKLLITKPIDIVKITSIYDSFKLNCEGIISEVENKKQESKEAEDLITQANYYRINYSESRSYLDDAEKYFNEGNFELAKKNAIKVLNTYKNVTSENDR